MAADRAPSFLLQSFEEEPLRLRFSAARFHRQNLRAASFRLSRDRQGLFRPENNREKGPPACLAVREDGAQRRSRKALTGSSADAGELDPAKFNRGERGSFQGGMAS
jgi:hypothetical protein